MRTIGNFVVVGISFFLAIVIIRHAAVWLGLAETIDWVEESSAIATFLFYIFAMILGGMITVVISNFLDKLDQEHFENNDEKNQ